MLDKKCINLYNINEAKMKDFDELGWLKEFKKESGWTFEKLAAEMGLHPMTLKKWFAGETKPSKLARKALITFMVEHM